MKILKAHEMAELDRITIEDIGIPSPVLMENAARGVLETILETCSPKRVLVIAGKGNNGGDGIALARMLHLKGVAVDLFLALGEPKGDAKTQLEIYKRVGGSVLRDLPDLNGYDLLVDGIFGTGFEPPVKGKIGGLIEKINASSSRVVAIDVPSGLHADSGKVVEPCVRADVTVTFQFPKVCHFLYPASKFCGEVFVKEISIPEYLAKDIKRDLITPDHLSIPGRSPDTYKNREGHVLVLGGSAGKTGAVVMSARAATRTGSGLVSVGVPEGLNPVVEGLLVEEMSIPVIGDNRLSFFCVERLLKVQNDFSALAVGMGMGRYEEGQDVIREILLGWEKPLIVDADGLNNLADLGLEVLKDRRYPTILTPHVGEFSRLTGVDKEEIIHNQIDLAQEFSTHWGVFLVLKSARVVVSTPEGRAYLSDRGTPAMAKGGSGDVLSGILLSMVGRMEDIEKALITGVFLHGIAGELAEERLHRESVGAMDIVEAIPDAYKKVENFLKGSDTIH